MVVKQPLLRSVLPDGSVVLLVVLHDDRCAILRDNEMIHQAGGDADGIDGAVQRFMAMTQVTDVLGEDDEGDDGGDAGRGARADRSELRRDVDPLAPQPAGGAAPEVTPPAAAPGTSA
jgi:hypothetical protein